MNYPVWDVPIIGGGVIIAVIAIVHVFVAHFAVGGGLFLVLTERKAYREHDDRVLAYVRTHSRFFILLTLVFGAVTGVGIWFSIGLVHPEGTSALIHNFVWAWAIEWVFFVVEIAAAIIYYYGWDRLDRRTHMRIGWIYFGGAWMSLFVINGILTFMLTPGRWLETREFWDAFFNPTYWPSLFMRTWVAIALAGLYGLVTASLLKPEDHRNNMVRYTARWLAPAFVFLPIGAAWFFAQAPESARHMAFGGAAAVSIFLQLSLLFSVLIFVFAYFGVYRRPERFSFSFAVLFLVMGLIVTGTSEWVREAVRKPYVITDYMYSNSVLVGDEERLSREGVLATSPWTTVKDTSRDRLEAGREVFLVQCSICHTTDAGYNAVAPLVKDWPADYIDHQLRNLNTLKPFMPPFVGTDEERRALAEYLDSLDGEVSEGGVRDPAVAAADGEDQ